MSHWAAFPHRPTPSRGSRRDTVQPDEWHFTAALDVPLDIPAQTDPLFSHAAPQVHESLIRHLTHRRTRHKLHNHPLNVRPPPPQPNPTLTPRSSSPPLSQVDPRAASEVHRNRRQLCPHAEKLPADAGQREADELDQPPGGAGGAPAAEDAAEQHVVQQGGA